MLVSRCMTNSPYLLKPKNMNTQHYLLVHCPYLTVECGISFSATLVDKVYVCCTIVKWSVFFLVFCLTVCRWPQRFDYVCTTFPGQSHQWSKVCGIFLDRYMHCRTKLACHVQVLYEKNNYRKLLLIFLLNLLVERLSYRMVTRSRQCGEVFWVTIICRCWIEVLRTEKKKSINIRMYAISR